ncbi:MAG: hypothetical protein QNJ73_11985, partial [Gammaproteobacteria bacterium]|nr:hypothetical protein [Gammaproteobacteria bacterium]
MSIDALGDAHTRLTAGDKAGAWLHATRSRAWQQFAAHGFPSQRHEDWKYTNLKPFADRTVDYLANQSPVTADSDAPLPASASLIEDTLRIVIRNGRVIELP